MKQVTDRFDEGKRTVNEFIKFLENRGAIEVDTARKMQALFAKPPTVAENGWVTVFFSKEACLAHVLFVAPSVQDGAPSERKQKS